MDDPAKYGTANNRLMKIVRTRFEPGAGQESASSTGPGIESVDGTESTGGVESVESTEPLAPAGGTMAAGGGGFPPPPGETPVVEWTKYYFYSSDGNVFEDEGTVERIVTEVPGQAYLTAVRFGYGANERTVTHVLGEKWDNPAVPPFVPYSVTFARQFRYDGARQRYLSRELDPADTQGYLDEVLSETWSDYDGDSIYGDWTLDGTERMPLRSYEPGLATTDQLAGGGPENTMYLHTSAPGSTMATSDQYGLGTFNTAYTAFGERITGPFQRYGFAGAHGYQSHEDFPFQHLGHRYYNPATGRFLQRDPIGITGGVNVYAYVENVPTMYVDPTGMINTGRIRYGWSRLPGKPPGVGSNAFRIGTNIHLRGLAGAGALGLSCALAAGVGYGTGKLIDYGVEKTTGRSLSERIGRGLGNACTWCFNW